jgi:hypothetical protein
VNKSAHGVRKFGATRAANNGATVAELEAIFGWIGGRMASLLHASRRSSSAIDARNRQTLERKLNFYRRTYRKGAARKPESIAKSEA